MFLFKLILFQETFLLVKVIFKIYLLTADHPLRNQKLYRQNAFSMNVGPIIPLMKNLYVGKTHTA